MKYTKLALGLVILSQAAVTGGFSVANAAEPAINIDFQTTNATYEGLGLLGSNSDTKWNKVGPNGAGGTNLSYADGSGPSNISVSTTHGASFSNGARPNYLVFDWVYTWGPTETITVSGLAPNTTFDISFYNGFYGQDYTVANQPGLITEIRPDNNQCGVPSNPSSCNGIMSSVHSDANGNITITSTSFQDNVRRKASTIAGMQILQTSINTPLVFGNTYISTGASAQVDGDIVANTYLVSGADTAVKGNIQVGAAVTTGATTAVTGYIKAGTAITLGATTVVDGDVCYGTALTQGAGASFYYDDCSMNQITYTRDDVIAAQDSFNALTPLYLIDRNQLSPTMPGDLTLNADDGLTSIIAATTVVYNATSLTTAAGVTLTLEGDYDWVFNITNMLSLGAGTKVELAQGSEGSITWNVGGYASIGSDAEIAGVILASGYISTGVRAKVNGAGRSSVTVEPSQSYCGGLFSANSYITIGASSTVSCE